MKTLTTHERMSYVYEHRQPDRVPITDWIWESTLENWHLQGLPQGCDWEGHFDLDRIVSLGLDVIDTSPRFPARIIEETNTYRIEVDTWGVTKKNFRPESSTPQESRFLDFRTEILGRS